jgi:hypothetical protein
MKSNKICSICLEDISNDKNVIELQCRHTFHEKCLTNYFKHNGKKSCPCPLCREKFNELNLKDKKPLKWVLRNRVNIDLEYNNDKIEILLRQYINNPFKNNNIISEIFNEIRNYIKHIFNDYFLKKADKKHILSHLKIITHYIFIFLPLYGKIISKYSRKEKIQHNKKIKNIKSDFVALLSTIESRKHVKKNILQKIYDFIRKNIK